MLSVKVQKELDRNKNFHRMLGIWSKVVDDQTRLEESGFYESRNKVLTYVYTRIEGLQIELQSLNQKKISASPSQKTKIRKKIRELMITYESFSVLNVKVTKNDYQDVK